MANEKNLKESILAASPFLIKVLETVLAIFTLCLIIAPYNNKLQPGANKTGFIYSSCTGAILINTLIIICHFLGERIQKKTCLIISSFYGVLLLIAGILIIHDWRNVPAALYLRPSKYHMDMLIASGVFCILTSVSFFVDIILTFRYG